MEMNPQRVRSAEFKTVRKGADHDEVRVFLNDVADELERAQNQATAMEARARAAVARLQEATENEAVAIAVLERGRPRHPSLPDEVRGAGGGRGGDGDRREERAGERAEE